MRLELPLAKGDLSNEWAAIRRRLPLLLIPLLVIFVALFLHGGVHGLYADDYVYQLAGKNWAAANWNITFPGTNRGLGILLAVQLAAQLPQDELFVRVGIAILHLVNVLLLGLLAYRLTGSELLAWLSSAFFLVPVAANEGLIWFSGAVFYSVPLFLLLTGFHLAMTRRVGPGQLVFSLGAILAWAAMILFIESGFFVLLLLPAFAVLLQRRGMGIRTWMSIPVLAVIYVFFGLYALFVLRASPVVAVHGAVLFDPVAILTRRIPETIDSLLSHFAMWLPAGIFFEALQLGVQEWLASAAGWVLLPGLALGLILCTNVLTRGQPETSAVPLAGPLSALGFAWMALALAPVLFIGDLTISSRVLLFPSAGFALALAGSVGWVVNRCGNQRSVALRVTRLLAAIVVFVNALTMAGLVQVYGLRSELDRRQIQMLEAAVPAMPSSGVWLMPLALNEHSVSARLGRATVLDNYLYGLFEIPWAAEPAVQLEYGNEGLHVIDKDEHHQVHLTEVGYTANRQVDTLTFEGAAQRQIVPLSQILAFTFRQGRLVLFNPLIISSPENPSTTVLDLPFASTTAHSGVESQSFTLQLGR